MISNLTHLTPVEKKVAKEIESDMNRNPEAKTFLISQYSERIARVLRKNGWFAILTNDNKMEIQKAI